MTRMLGRYQVPGCCPGTRAGLPPGPDCSGGGGMDPRKRKRQEARELAAELAPDADDREWLASLLPLFDLSDCMHGCNGDCVEWGGERCTFICHPA